MQTAPPLTQTKQHGGGGVAPEGGVLPARREKTQKISRKEKGRRPDTGAALVDRL